MSLFALGSLIVFFSSFQNCQHEIKRLREKELALQSELTSASKEILRLRELLKNYTTNPNSSSTVWRYGGGGVRVTSSADIIHNYFLLLCTYHFTFARNYISNLRYSSSILQEHHLSNKYLSPFVRLFNIV